MKKILGKVLAGLSLLAVPAMAAFSESSFNYGVMWDGAQKLSDFTGLSHIAMYAGDGSRDIYNTYWEGAMLRKCKEKGLTPVFYAYIIAEWDKHYGRSDCDVGTPNHCTDGADLIRNHWDEIIGRYKDLARGVASDYGTSESSIWLIEPDFFQYSVSGDAREGRFDQVGGGIPDAELAGKYFNDIVAAIKGILPNAKIGVDISPWLNEGLKSWYDNFDKSKVDYLFNSGGRTQGNQERIRNDNNNMLTWAQASSYMGGKKIIADDGYGVGGGAENNYGEWLSTSVLNARISDGVIGLTLKDPGNDFYTFAKNNPIALSGGSNGGSTSSSSNNSWSSSSSSNWNQWQGGISSSSININPGISLTIKPTRVGPVSQYGQLMAGKNADNHGRIYGSCRGVTPGAEVQVKGMSLYWSVDSKGTAFYTESAISKMVQDMNIEIIRIPVGTEENCWSGDCAGGYMNSASAQRDLVDVVVSAAIKNDIYVIIDWHSHTAENQKGRTNGPQDFFAYMAEKYGAYDNVIFEIYNEPKGEWGSGAAVSYWNNTLHDYAKDIVSVIRSKNSDNLIVVGNPYFDQYPYEATRNPIADNNVAYTFHYYAASHKTSSEGDNADRAIKAGYSVFVTEWGTGTSDGGGNGDYTSINNEWQTWMDQRQLSWANWSASMVPEYTAAFNSSSTNSLTTSGTLVKGYLASNPSSYSKCGDPVVKPNSSSSSFEVASSSSVALTEANLIDDFEDGDSIAYTGHKDTWFAFTDIGDNGASSIQNVKNATGYDVVYAADNGSKYMAGLKGILLSQGGNKYDPYVTLGLDVNNGMAGCKTITYKYKGAGHNLKTVTKGDEEGALSEYNYHKFAVDGSSSWQTATVPVLSLGQEPGWGKTFTLNVSNIVKLQWEVKGTASANSLYIDDLACDGMKIVRETYTPVATVFTPAAENTTQNVVAGQAIEPIVFSYANVKSISVDSLPKGLSALLDTAAKTYTISGTVDAALGTHDYTYVIKVTGVDENTEVKGTIKVTRAPLVATFTPASEEIVNQEIVAGQAITPIVFHYENITNIKIAGLPKGLSAAVDQDAKTYTISGVVDSTLTDHEYEYVVTVGSESGDLDIKGVIKVAHAPVAPVFAVASEASLNQEIVAGNAIEPIVFSYANIKSVSVDSLPLGLNTVLDQEAKTYTIQGVVDVSLTDKDYGYVVNVTGVDSDTTVRGVIKVAHAPVAPVFAVASEASLNQEIVAGNAIEPIVFSYANVKSVSVDSLPLGLNTVLDQEAKTYTIQGVVDASLTDKDYGYVVNVTGVDSDTTVRGVIKVAHAPVAPVFAVASEASLNQEIVAGNAIEPIVFSYANVKSVSVDSLPKGLGAVLDETTNTYTISGVVDSTLTDNEYIYVVKVIGVDSDTTVRGIIKVAHKPVAPVFAVSSEASLNQEIVAGNAIEPIVFSYANVKSVSVDSLPKGLGAVLDEKSNTYTISGVVDSTLTDNEYAYVVKVVGVDSDTTVRGLIKVAHAPVAPVFAVASEASLNQEIVAGNAIEPIVFSYANIKSVSVDSLPKGLGAVLDETTNTYTINGVVDSTLSTHDYKYVITVIGVDSDTTVSGIIKVTAAPEPESSSSEPESSSSDEAESSSSEISSSSEELSSSSETSSSSEVASSSSEAESSSSEIASSSSIEESSSSEASSSSVAESSSSSEEPSSSSVEESSSSVEPESSSSDEPESSSSIEVVESSSSESSSSSVASSSSEISSSSEELSSSSETSSSSEVASSSSETESSSSVEAESSSSEVESSSSDEPESSSSEPESSSSSSEDIESSSSETPVVAWTAPQKLMSITLSGRQLAIHGASNVQVDVFDMQGRPLKAFRSVSGTVSLESMATGNYIVRVRKGSNSLVKRISIR